MDINTLLLSVILVIVLVILWVAHRMDKYIIRQFSRKDNSDDTEIEDDLYEEALKLLNEAKHITSSYLQRKLRIGYARAARLVDILEEGGYIEEQQGATPRKVLKRPSDTRPEV